MYDLRKEMPVEIGSSEVEETWETQPRLEMPKLTVKERKRSFEEIEQGFSEAVAKQEAKRCLRCDLEI
jgi:hypothetical protein